MNKFMELTFDGADKGQVLIALDDMLSIRYSAELDCCVIDTPTGSMYVTQSFNYIKERLVLAGTTNEVVV